MEKLNRIAEYALSRLAENGADMAHVTASESEKREFNADGSGFTLFRTLFDSDLSLTGYAGGRRGTGAINSFSDADVAAAAKDVMTTAATAEPDPAWSESEGSGTLYGNLLMVCACLCWTGYILATPRLMQACSSTRVTTWQALAAVVTLAPLALAEHSLWVVPTPRALFCIFMLSAVGSALCYVVYGVAIRSVDSLTVSLSININPIVACVAGALMLGEMLTASQMLGGLMIMIAVLADSLEEGGFLTKKRA